MKKSTYQRFSLRKFKIGTGSILLGSLLVMGIQYEAQASENDIVDTDNSNINNEATNTYSENNYVEQPSDATQSETTNETNGNTDVTTNETSEAPEATNDEATSYTAKQYPDQDTNSIVVANDVDAKKDTNKDGALTYFKEQNGYVPEQTQTVKNSVKTSEHCTADEVTTEYTNKVNLNAKSVMDTNLDDYSNNGYQEKVKNPNNHPNATDVNNYGPGNLEVQHWQTGSNEATTAQNWRIVFATDYAIDNAVMRVTLPYDNVTTSDASDWLVNRYYPAISKDGKSTYTNIITPENITFDGNIAIINLGNVVANSAYGIVFNKQFDTSQDFSGGPLTTSVNVSGEWNEKDLRRRLELKKESMRAQGMPEEEINKAELDYIKSNLTPKQVEYINEVCEVPDNPDNPDKPDNPDNPDKPDNPDNPDKPDNPDNPDNPSNMDNPDNPDNPSNMDNPDNPDNPSNMDNSDNPDNPSNMDNTGHSNNVVPVKSDNSVSSNSIVKLNDNKHAHNTKDNTHKLPDTGESKVEHITLFGTLIVILGSSFLLFRRKNVRR